MYSVGCHVTRGLGESEISYLSTELPSSYKLYTVHPSVSPTSIGCWTLHSIAPTLVVSAKVSLCYIILCQFSLNTFRRSRKKKQIIINNDDKQRRSQSAYYIIHYINLIFIYEFIGIY